MREPTRSPDAATTTAAATGVEPTLELGVQGDETDRAATHGHEGHHVRTRVEPACGQSLADEVEHAVEHGLRPAAADEVEVLVELDLRAEHAARFVD